MKIVAFTRHVLIGKLFIFFVFGTVLCQRNLPENQIFNNRQWSIGPSARCKCGVTCDASEFRNIAN